MNDEIKRLLEEEIKEEIEDLAQLTPGSVEKSAAIDDLVKLYKLRIEQFKNESEAQEKRERRIMEVEQHQIDASIKEKQLSIQSEQHQIDTAIKEKQMSIEIDIHDRDEQFKRDQLSEQIRDRYFRLGVDIAGVVLPLIFYAVWMKRGFKFEESGTYTSTTFRGLFNRFRPTK